MNEKRIQELKQALNEFVSSILNSGEEIDDELQYMIVQAMEHVTKRIQALRQEEETGIPPIEDIEEEQAEVAQSVSPAQPPTPPTGGPAPAVDRAPHESSNINGFKYDPRSQKLYIKFMGKDTADSGPIYRYEGVPQNIFDVILRGGVAPLTSGKNKYHTWHKGITPSHGASVSALIKKGNYQYTRMS